MMVYSVGSSIWLCWILLSVTPLVQCQFGNNPFSGSPFGSGGGKSPIGNVFPSPNGGFSGGGFQGGGFNGGFSPGFRPGQNQQFGNKGQGKGGEEDQEREDITSKETAASEVAESTKAAEPEEEAPSSTAAEATEVPEETAAVNDETVVATPQTVSTTPTPAPVTATPAIPIAEEPTSVPNAIGEPESTSNIAAAPIVAPASSNTAYNGLLTSAVPVPLPVDSASATSTVTTSETVIVTPSPVSDPEPEPAVPDSEPEPTSTSPASAIGQAPLSESPGPTMSASARAGMGVGVTFGIISIAGMAGFYLWRRHHNQRYERDFGSGGLGGFFMLNRKNSKGDAEWEVGNAEKVEIVRGASARTVSRSDSSRKPSRDGGSSDGGGEKIGLSILKVGMRVPDRPNPALTSNPPMPSPSQFPSPPSSRGTLSSMNEKERKKNSWPLPE